MIRLTFPQSLKCLAVTVLLMLFSGCKELQPALETMNEISQAYQAPSQVETSQAIKLALNNGIESAVKRLGKANAFSNSQYRIPLPGAIQSYADDARRFGLGSYVDSFETSLNRAAEQALPEAITVFKHTLKQMTVTDVIDIMRGSDTAATDFFKSRARQKLKSRFMPIVQNATNRVGVTKKYKRLTDKLSGYAALMGSTPPENTDLDAYVTDKAIEALFSEVAIVEKNIRSNPLQHSSELIKKVFSYYR